MNVIDSFRLDGRVAYVTGGAMGIGKACALGLAEAGADVAIVDINRDAAEEAVSEVKMHGRKSVFVECDVTVREQVDAMVEEVAKELGGFDIAMNNAGICVNETALEMTDEQWLKVINVNLNSVFYCAQAAGRAMIASGKGGSIINTASMSAQVVNRPQCQCAYNASKAGVIQLTRSMAAEWAMKGVRVNTISPGYTGTELTMRLTDLHPHWCKDTPMDRLAKPEEIKGAVVFLASSAAAFVTGHDLVIDGGFTCW